MELANLSGLSETQMAIREGVLELLRRVLPREKIRALDAEGAFPEEAYAALAEAGWMGLFYPEAVGGMAGSYKDLAVLVEALGYHWAPMAATYLQTTINAGAHLLHAGEHLQKMILPGVISGKTRLAVSITEPGSGSDVASIRTRAVRHGDRYVINGQKLYTTAAAYSDYLVVATKTNPEAGRKGISVMLVDTKSPGLTIKPVKTVGRRTQGTSEVFFDNVETPAAWVIGEENDGWNGLMRCLNVERLCQVATAAGNCFLILEDAIDYAKTRIQFGQPISSFQAIQHKLANMRMLAENTRLHAYRVAELLDSGQPAIIETAMAKAVAAEANFTVADEGLQILGGAGYTMEYDMQMYFRDSRILRIGGGSTEIMRNVIAKQLGV